MLKIAREFLEQSDLEQLHLQFDESKEDWVEQNEIELPMFDSCKKEDLWTEAIEAVSTQNVAKMRNVYTKIMHSDMSLEGKAWWESILTIGMNRHDIGKTALPETIINKKGRLSSAEHEFVKARCSAMRGRLAFCLPTFGMQFLTLRRLLPCTISAW